MAISKQKVIIALIPFIVTTLGIIIFLIFFNFSTITFQGESPFSVQAGSTNYHDIDGKVELYIRSGDYDFIVTKPDNFEQKISETLLWKENKKVDLTFTYKPKVVTKKFLPLITYTNETPIVDNQNTDLLFATFSPQKITLPEEYNRVVWGKDGSKACLFATQNSVLPPKLWSKTNIIKNLPNTTFDCYATDQGLLIAQIENQKLLLNGKAIEFLLPSDFTIVVNPTGEYIAIIQKDVVTSKYTVAFIDLKTNKNIELGSFSSTEPARFISSETFGIKSDETLTFYHPSFSGAKTVSTNLPLSTLSYDEQKETFYYVGSEEETNTSILPSLNEFGFSADTKPAILSYKANKKQIVFTLPNTSQFTKSIVSADQKQIAFYSSETNDLAILELMP